MLTPSEYSSEEDSPLCESCSSTDDGLESDQAVIENVEEEILEENDQRTPEEKIEIPPITNNRITSCEECGKLQPHIRSK